MICVMSIFLRYLGRVYNTKKMRGLPILQKNINVSHKLNTFTHVEY